MNCTLGCIRPGYIKNAAKQLLQNYEEEFTTDFEKNKRLVEKYSEGYTKTVRNRIAGYLVRMVRIKQAREARIASEPEEPIDTEM